MSIDLPNFEKPNKFEENKNLLLELASTLSNHFNFSLPIEDLKKSFFIYLPNGCQISVRKLDGSFFLGLQENFENLKTEVYSTENRSLIKKCQIQIPGFKKIPSEQDIKKRKELRQIERNILQKLYNSNVCSQRLPDFEENKNIEVVVGADAGVITNLEQCRYLWSVGMGPCVTFSLSQNGRALMVHVDNFYDLYGDGTKSAKPFLDEKLSEFDPNKPYTLGMVGGNPKYGIGGGRRNILDIYQYLASKGFDQGVFKTSIGDSSSICMILDLQSNEVYSTPSDENYYSWVEKNNPRS